MPARKLTEVERTLRAISRTAGAVFSVITDAAVARAATQAGNCEAARANADEARTCLDAATRSLRRQNGVAQAAMGPHLEWGKSVLEPLETALDRTCPRPAVAAPVEEGASKRRRR